MEPFVINVDGRAEIPHPAERAVINVLVASAGTNKASVSDEVLTSARHLETLLRELSPQDKTPEAKEASPLAHWSKTSLSATSHVPYNAQKEIYEARQFNASISFDIRFKEFKALGGFGARLSALPHVEVPNIDWILTEATEKSYRSQLRKEAARDALQKARDYCEVMNCTNVRPVELEEGYNSPATFSSAPRRVRAVQAQEMPGRSRMMAQHAPGFAPDVGEDERDESPLEFRPEEVRMSMNVTVKFHAEYVAA